MPGWRGFQRGRPRGVGSGAPRCGRRPPSQAPAGRPVFPAAAGLVLAPLAGMCALRLAAAASTLLALAAAGPAAADPAAAPAEAGCLLFIPGNESAPAADCLRCHDGSVAATHLETTHPVDLDYAMAWARDPQGKRPEAEVIRRGGFLPEGKVRCTTCHDARSPWADKLVLPPGARPTGAVNPRDPDTYAPGRPAAPLPPGSKVSPKPLCLLCHALD